MVGIRGLGKYLSAFVATPESAEQQREYGDHNREWTAERRLDQTHTRIRRYAFMRDVKTI